MPSEAIDAVRVRNSDKVVYGGNGWANYAAQYFTIAPASSTVRLGVSGLAATALVVIGNSILQGVPIPTDRFLAAIAEARGFQVADIHVPREARVGSSIVESSVRAGKATAARSTSQSWSCADFEAPRRLTRGWPQAA